MTSGAVPEGLLLFYFNSLERNIQRGSKSRGNGRTNADLDVYRGPRAMFQTHVRTKMIKCKGAYWRSKSNTRYYRIRSLGSPSISLNAPYLSPQNARRKSLQVPKREPRCDGLQSASIGSKQSGITGFVIGKELDAARGFYPNVLRFNPTTLCVIGMAQRGSSASALFQGI